MSENDKDDPENLKVMGIFEHIDELRSRLMVSASCLVVMFLICYFWVEYIWAFLKKPLMEVLPAKSPSLYFTGPMDIFMGNMKISLFAAVVFSCPIWIYQLWKFLEPALYEKEKKYAIPFIVSSIGLFVSGVLLCYYVILPMTLKYLIGLGAEMDITPIITISDYLSLIMMMMVGFGAVFETPVILVMLALLGLITAEDLRKNRKFVVVGIFIIAAVITPTPDPWTQGAMALPTWVLFEASILLIALLQRSKDRQERASKSKPKG